MGFKLKGWKDVKVFDYTPFLRGSDTGLEYVLESKFITPKESQVPGKGDYILAEFTVVEAPEHENANEVGTDVAYQIKTEGRGKYDWRSDYKGLLAAAFGVDADDISEEAAQALLDGVDEKGKPVAFEGYKVRATAKTARSKDGAALVTKKGEPIYNVKFSAFEE